MRITPIQNCNYFTNTYNAGSVNYKPKAAYSSDVFISSSAPKQKNNVNFTGNIHNLLSVIPKKVQLDDKIAALFDEFKRGDVITVGKDFKETQKALKDAIGTVDHIIKRVFFIKDNEIDGSIAFFKNATGEKEVLNLNKFDLFLSSEQGQDALKPQTSFYIMPGDILYVGKKGIMIKDSASPDLASERHKFSKVFDFTNDSIDIIKRQNQKQLATLVREVKTQKQPISFADVGGQDKVIDELKKGILYPIKYPEAFENVSVNHGTILTGPPGTGKTLIAEALANESNAYFKKLNGSELKSKWIGESESNLRDLFAEAVEKQPSIIVFDEFDSVAKKRDKIDHYSAEFVNQLLSIMSDIEKNGDDVYILATTNKVDMLDEAIRRSGRFGKHIEVGPPDLNGTKQILGIHSAKKPLDESVDIEQLSGKLHKIKATGADIARIVSDAHSNAYQRLGIFEKMDNGTFTRADIDRLKITPEDFDKAINDFVAESKVAERKKIGFN